MPTPGTTAPAHCQGQVQRRALPGSIGLGHAKDAAAKPCRQQQSRHAPPGCKGARIARRKPTFDTALERRLNGELAGRARGQACKRALRAGGVELAHARRPHVWSRASPAASEAEAAYRTSSSHHTNTQVTHRGVVLVVGTRPSAAHDTVQERGGGTGRGSEESGARRTISSLPYGAVQRALPRASAPLRATRRRERVRADLRLLGSVVPSMVMQLPAAWSAWKLRIVANIARRRSLRGARDENSSSVVIGPFLYHQPTRVNTLFLLRVESSAVTLSARPGRRTAPGARAAHAGPWRTFDNFRISNSLEHLRAEERGGGDADASNPDLLVLRKLIEEARLMSDGSMSVAGDIL